MMRTMTIAATILATVAALFGSVLLAQAKGGETFRAEISGGDLTEPVTIDGPVSMEVVFLEDDFEVAPPASLEPAYTVKLIPLRPDGTTSEYPTLTLTYFPGQGDALPILSGDWDRDRYFLASHQFKSMLEEAIGAAKTSGMTARDDGVSAVWYIAPSLAAVGLVLIGGLAGRRLLFRLDE